VGAVEIDGAHFEILDGNGYRSIAMSDLGLEEAAYYKSQEMRLEDAISELAEPDRSDIFSIVGIAAAKLVVVDHLGLLDELLDVLRDYTEDDSFVSDCLAAYPDLEHVL
jgi:hypothetical protein